MMLLASTLATSGGCVDGDKGSEVVAYVALDQEFAKPILAGFQRRQEEGFQVRALYDVESTKTIGLVNRIFSERERTRCDVFWNNEVMHTIRLQRAGLLRPYDWPVPADWPDGMIAGDMTWCGFAARARVLIVNTDLLPDPAQWPRSVSELADPKWKGRCAIARPLFGTTATHAAVLDVLWGHERAEKFFTAVSQQAVVLSGNKQVAQNVSAGEVAWGLTDTDDAIIEVDQRLPVQIVFPDQQPSQPGTLRIPNTLCILADAPHPRAAADLVDYLLRPDTEERLAMGSSSQIPLNRDVEYQPRVLPQDPVRWLDADFEAAAERWEKVAELLATLFAS